MKSTTTEPQDYEVTDKAGPRVAGEIVGGRKTLRLTPAQAEYELREGTIVPAPPTVKPPGDKPAGDKPAGDKPKTVV